MRRGGSVIRCLDIEYLFDIACTVNDGDDDRRHVIRLSCHAIEYEVASFDKNTVFALVDTASEGEVFERDAAIQKLLHHALGGGGVLAGDVVADFLDFRRDGWRNDDLTGRHISR